MLCLVTSPQGQRLVRSKSNKAAIDFVVAGTVTSKAVNADEVVDLISSGMKVEDALDQEEAIVESAPPAEPSVPPAETNSGDTNG